MTTRMLDRRGLALLAAIPILVAATTVAHARMGGMGSTGQMHGMAMGPGSGVTTARHPYPPGYAPPPYIPNGPQRSNYAGEPSGGGGTGGFNPGGGSGTKPIKKPNIQ